MLFIGCGGSGGVTLQYLMDSLRTELRREVERSDLQVDLPPGILPDAWQFLHIDVRDTPDTADGEGRPPAVPDQGGHYLGLARQGLRWEMVADQVWNRGRVERPDLVAGWLRKPDSHDPALVEGAGQERAVGRGATLNAVQLLHEALYSAVSRMSASGGTQQLGQLAQALGTSADRNPLVFIVSSMAGGSGASMVLDVAQVLYGIDSALKATTAMFLYTSEVFTSLPQDQRRGVEANGLAALGELLATSLGACPDDSKLLELMGGIAGAGVHQPFKRVFPIGLRHGPQQAVFGDGTLEGVYRAVGRALAGLISSPTALRDFVSYDLTNVGTQDTDMSWIGEGSSSDSVLWGTLGFARLSIGRDRYGEYVAQRLSRASVDRLVSGHLELAGDAGEAALQQSVKDARRQLLHRMNIPQEGEVKVLSLLSRKSPDSEQVKRDLRRGTTEIINQQVFGDGELQGHLAGPAFANAVNRVLTRAGRPLQKDLRDRAYGLAYEWHRAFVTDLTAELDRLSAAKGLPTVRQLVLQLSIDAERWSQQLSAQAARMTATGALGALSAKLSSLLQGQTAIGVGHPAQVQVANDLAEGAAKNTAGYVAQILSEVFADFRQSFAMPLAQALAGQLAVLGTAQGTAAKSAGPADLRTSAYALWPDGSGIVSQRFDSAHNEVTLMDAEKFPGQFDAHIQAIVHARPGVATVGDAVDLAITEIVTYRWQGNNDEDSESRNIRIVKAWVPQVLSLDPSDPMKVRAQSAASFACELSPQVIVERARDWVWNPDGEIGPYLGATFATYMSTDDLDYGSRRAQLVTKFREVMQQALPLVGVNGQAFSRIHSDALEVNYKFSAVPFDINSEIARDLGQEIVRSAHASGHSAQAFNEALTQSGTADRIDIFSTYAPMSPLAFGSLLKPIDSALKMAAAQGDSGTKRFWKNRRARPLPSCIPMSPAERRATVAGYVIGKVTGRMRGKYERLPNVPHRHLEVYCEEGERWLPFPKDLTPYDKPWQVDELPTLLENHLVAVAACGNSSDLGPLQAYRTLRHTFAELLDAIEPVYDNTNGDYYLQRWIVDGWRPTGADPARWNIGMSGDVVDLGAPEGRKEAALAFLTHFRDKTIEDYHPEDPRANRGLHPYNRRPMMAAIADDFVWACSQVMEMVQTIDVGEEGSGPGSGFFEGM